VVEDGDHPAADARPDAGGSRRQARERALSLLYEAETKDVSPAAVLSALPVEPAPYASDIVTGVGEHRVRQGLDHRPHARP
jgi:hypothetical protein